MSADSSRQGVIVLGSANVDLVIRGPRLPRPGETVLGGEFFRAGGGKGANQAVAAARAARQPVWFIGAVGDDTLGSETRAALSQENLRLDYLSTVAHSATGVALILVDAVGENMISVASGANGALSPDAVVAVPDDVWRQAAVFLTNLETPLAAVVQGLRQAKKLGLTTVLNPAPAVHEILAADVAPLVDVLTPNETEAAQLADIAPQAGLSPEILAERLADRGFPVSVITLGSAGCLVRQDEQTVQIPALKVRAVDATGAGDAFNGALAVALAEGRPLVEAAAWANRAAALAVTVAGAQPSLPRRAAIEAAG